MENAQILVCDDEIGIRDSLRLILETDYQLCYARNGQEVVTFLKDKKNRPDLLIMDIKMPHLNGMDTLRQLRRIRPHLKILIITGYESSDVAAEALELGATDYLTKPFDRDTVKQKVRTLLSMV